MNESLSVPREVWPESAAVRQDEARHAPAAPVAAPLEAEHPAPTSASSEAGVSEAGGEASREPLVPREEPPAKKARKRTASTKTAAPKKKAKAAAGKGTAPQQRVSS